MSGPQVITSAEELRKLLATRQKVMGLSSEAIARRAGYSDSAYWAWQRRQRKVTLEAALCYATVLGYRITVEPVTR